MKWRPRRLRALALALVVLGLAAPARAILFYTFLPHNGAGEAHFCPPRRLDPSAIGVPCGYCIEPVACGLTYPTAVVTDEYTVADPVLPAVSYDGWCSL